MEVLRSGCQFVELHSRQAATDDDGRRVVALGLVNELSALGGGGVCHTARVDDDEVWRRRDIDLKEVVTFEQFADLLALVLVNFTAHF